MDFPVSNYGVAIPIAVLSLKLCRTRPQSIGHATSLSYVDFGLVEGEKKAGSRS
jgi:hypothetical protein